MKTVKLATHNATDDEYLTRRHDYVQVSWVDGYSDREVPFTGRIVSIVDDETIKVTSDEDDHPPDRVHVNHAIRRFPTEESAAAFLAARSISAWAEAFSMGRLVKVYLPDDGKNFSNVGCTFDLDVGEIGPVDAYNQHIREYAPEWAAVYANFIARGVRPRDTEDWASGSPLHNNTRAGPEPKPIEEVDRMTLLAAESAGIVPEAGLPSRQAD